MSWGLFVCGCSFYQLLLNRDLAFLVLSIHFWHVCAVEEVVPLGAPLLWILFISQTDLSTSLSREKRRELNNPGLYSHTIIWLYLGFITLFILSNQILTRQSSRPALLVLQTSIRRVFCLRAVEDICRLNASLNSKGSCGRAPWVRNRQRTGSEHGSTTTRTYLQ